MVLGNTVTAVKQKQATRKSTKKRRRRKINNGENMGGVERNGKKEDRIGEGERRKTKNGRVRKKITKMGNGKEYDKE